MLKKLLIMILILTPYSWAGTLTTQFDSYYGGETVTGYIDLEFISDNEIDIEKIQLIRSNNTKVNAAINLVKLDTKKYFYYFKLPLNLEAGAYLISLSDLVAVENGTLKKVNITKSFNLDNSKFGLSIDPGLIYVHDINEKNIFELKFVNSGDETNVGVDPLDFNLVSNQQFKISGNTSYTIQVKFDRSYYYKDGYNGDILVDYDDRELRIPVYVKSGFVRINDSSKKMIDQLNPRDMVNLSIYSNQTVNGPLIFRNSGGNVINDLAISFTGNIQRLVSIEIDEYSNIAPGDLIRIDLFINKNGEIDPGSYDGNLNLRYDGNFLNYPIQVTVNPINSDFLNDEGIIRNQSAIILEEDLEKESNNSYFVIIALIIILLIFLVIKNRAQRRKKKARNFDFIFSKYLKK